MSANSSDNGRQYYSHSPYTGRGQLNHGASGGARAPLTYQHQFDERGGEGAFRPQDTHFSSHDDRSQDVRRQGGRSNDEGAYYSSGVDPRSALSMPYMGGFPAGNGRAVSNSSVTSSQPSGRHRRGGGSRCGGPSRSGELLAVNVAEGAASHSGDSNASSIAENLPLCPDDSSCSQINEKAHQHRYAHTCRLYPCYHGHIRRHARLFRHTEGQIAASGPSSSKSRMISLASVNFASISPDAPNATRITVSGKDVAYDIFGDWSQVKVHTFKRYLHQVFGVEPRHQQLALDVPGAARVQMDDDLETVQRYLAPYPTALGIILSNTDITVSDAERRRLREAIENEL